MKLINKKCSKCNININQSNWYRLVSGFLLCSKCWYEILESYDNE